MKRALIIAAILLVGAGFFSLNRLIWLSPDYAAVGTCTAAEIDRTYAGLGYANGFVYAANERASHELWNFHGGMDLHASANRRREQFIFDLNRRIFAMASKRDTAAYVCSHVTSYFGRKPRLENVPQIAAAIMPFVPEAKQAWPVATCAATLGRCFGEGELSQESVDFAMVRCADREESASSQHSIRR